MVSVLFSPCHLATIPLIVAFFVGGMLFAYYIMLDPALDVLLNFMGIATLPRPSCRL